ncbi:hypothetical protein H7849_20290 [Alloacidobacterium dinghuense]|uniref:Uncharacterized protein n=1 Tax=Alloacidobacterium dinghuense TaxID=2763107 RepID=A0A7G8BFS3_9BACT|nr:hypothetical protein [Alloacidobacterium dinghuense]QNI31393.1 hypothetical protein H7849_20290 [Alloacidobacterium dinghuense]
MRPKKTAINKPLPDNPRPSPAHPLREPRTPGPARKRAPSSAASPARVPKRYPWVLDTLLYRDTDHLLEILPEKVIRSSEAIIDAQSATRA